MTDLKTTNPSYQKVVGTQHQIKCNLCDKKLGILFESDKISTKFQKMYRMPDVIVKYGCICKCGGESFLITSPNECYFIKEDSLSITKADVLISNNVFKNIVTLA